MGKELIIEEIYRHKVIFIIRADHSRHVPALVHAIWEAGGAFVEVTLNTPGALDAVQQLSSEVPIGCYLGMGTVLNSKDVHRAHDVGASFVVSPISSIEIIKTCHQNDLCCIAGAFTPTEIYQTWMQGADFVKVFPAEKPSYIRSIHAPLDQIPLLAVDGVTMENATDFIEAGSVGIAVGKSLLGVNSDGEHDTNVVQSVVKELIGKVIR